jgi:hypothetical protein
MLTAALSLTLQMYKSEPSCVDLDVTEGWTLGIIILTND